MKNKIKNHFSQSTIRRFPTIFTNTFAYIGVARAMTTAISRCTLHF